MFTPLNLTPGGTAFPSSAGPTSSSKPSPATTVPNKPCFATSAVRNQDEIRATKPQFSRDWRVNASSKERQTFIEKVSQGAPAKMSKVDYVKLNDKPSDNVLFTTNVEVDTFISNFKRHCICYDVVYTLQNFPLLESPLSNDSDRFRSGKTIDLFKNWDRIGPNKELTLEGIADAIQWLKRFTTTACQSYLDDMEWTHCHLLNSMDPDLSNSVISTLNHDFDAGQMGGPLTFAVMIDKCINLSENAIEALAKSIENFDIKTVPGENIETVVSRFKYAFKRLDNNNAVTSSLTKSLFKVFQTTSVAEFNDLVSHWAKDVAINPAVRPDYSAILNEVHGFYKSIIAEGDWNGIKEAEESAFFGGNGNRKNSGPYLFGPPTDEDKVSDSPLCYQRTIKGRTMKFCGKCVRNKLTKKLGRWNTTHFTHEHTGKRPEAANKASDESPDETPSATPSDTSGSFAQHLMDAQA
jgi:hypothetical protein